MSVMAELGAPLGGKDHQDSDPQALEAVPIGRRILGLLGDLNQSAAWLAERVGVARSTITRILNGERNPTPDTLQEIAPVLGLSVAQLVAGTNAAGRVKESEELIPRSAYESAVHQVIEFERQANELRARVRDLTEELLGEKQQRRQLSQELDHCCEDRDRARREAERREHEARRYREALERAVTDVAQLRAQVSELGAAVEANRRTGRVGAILAGVAAAVSVASYLNTDSANDDNSGADGKADREARTRKRTTKNRSRASRAGSRK
jgi:transcriptional regulator with XRE-family HTH domain